MSETYIVANLHVLELFKSLPSDFQKAIVAKDDLRDRLQASKPSDDVELDLGCLADSIHTALQNMQESATGCSRTWEVLVRF